MIFKPKLTSDTTPESLKSISIIYFYLIRLRIRNKQMQHKKISSSNHSIKISKPERQTNTSHHDQKT